VIPPWVDAREYPFTPRMLAVDAGRMSYLDEGEGPPVVMVHGTPTWSFLYRHLVKALAPRHRCIVPDLPGFGLSDRVSDASYRPEDQARRLTALIETLRLKDFTLVVHDFGGPIGLAHAIERPASVHRLVLFNTWMWSLAGDRSFRLVGGLLGGSLGRLALERLGLSTEVLWRRAIADRARYTRAVHAHYRAPMATRAARRATAVYARELLGSSAWYERLWSRRERIADIPALLIWGMKDPAFGKFLPRWQRVFTHVNVAELRDVGHAPPEERGPEVSGMVAQFLSH
jgi:haloalkane dehalogenase